MYALPATPSPSSVPPATPGADDRLSFSPSRLLGAGKLLTFVFATTPGSMSASRRKSAQAANQQNEKTHVASRHASPSTDGGSTWTEDGSAACDTASKIYEPTRVRGNTTFQLRFAEDVPYEAAGSPSVLVQVRHSLSEPTITPDPVPRGTDFSVSEELHPYHSGSTLLRFYFYLPRRGSSYVGYDEARNGGT